MPSLGLAWKLAQSSLAFTSPLVRVKFLSSCPSPPSIAKVLLRDKEAKYRKRDLEIAPWHPEKWAPVRSLWLLVAKEWNALGPVWEALLEPVK